MDSIIDIDQDDIGLCSRWHDGQASMMYAVASTGGLRRGSVRPHDAEYDDHGRTVWTPYTDAEWDRYLVSSLECECLRCLRYAEQANYLDDADLLRLLADRCSLWLAANEPIDA